MKKTVVLLIILTAGIIGLSTRKAVYATQVPQKAINIVLDHSNPNAPSVISVEIVNNNPEDYKLSIIDNYFMVREVDDQGSLLFEGEVKRYKLATTGDSANGQYTEIPDNPVIMDIPYHQEARKVLIFDEVGNLKLEIDLGSYSVGPTPTAGPRYAECNKCSYCRGHKPPSNLTSCMQCLYPDFVDNPDGSLVIDPIKRKPIQPRTGAYFTQIGCIDVGASGFRDAGAAGGVVNAILTRLFFPVAGVLSILALIYGAFLVMTAQNNAEQLTRGKKWIYGAIIGVVFTFMAILLIRIIAGDILKIPGFNM